MCHYLRTGSASFPTEQDASSWSSPLATTVANDLILVELDGKQHCLFYNSFPFSLNFNQLLCGTSWPVCTTALGMLIPRSGKGFIDSALNVLLLD